MNGMDVGVCDPARLVRVLCRPVGADDGGIERTKTINQYVQTEPDRQILNPATLVTPTVQEPRLASG